MGFGGFQPRFSLLLLLTTLFLPLASSSHVDEGVSNFLKGLFNSSAENETKSKENTSYKPSAATAAATSNVQKSAVPGNCLFFYSPKAIQELKALGVEITPDEALEDGGLFHIGSFRYRW